MSCTYKWDTKTFDGQKVRLSTSVKDNNGYDKDEATVLVSGHYKRETTIQANMSASIV